MLMQKERELIVEFGKKLNSSGLTTGTSGNLSIFSPEENLMAIGPSGIAYFDTLPEDVVILDLDGKQVDGKRSPSSEYDLHRVFYKHRPGIHAVVHTHSTYASSFACRRKSLLPMHYVIAGSGVSEIPCAKYATFGSWELAENALAAMGEGRACLLANHGVLALGVDIAKAYSLAANVEYCAKINYLCGDDGVALTKEEMEAVHQRMKGYGQVKK